MLLSVVSVSAAGTAELVLGVREQDVEAGEAAVAAGDVRLQAQLLAFGKVRTVHLLFQRAQAIAQHRERLDEGLAGHALLLPAPVPRARARVASPPPLRR